MLHDFSKDSFDIIVQAGQSNSDGSGYGDAAQPFQPDPRIWYLNRDFTISQAADRVRGNFIFGDFSLRFAEEYIKAGLLAPDRKLLIIRSAVGGTGFLDHRWGPEDDLFLHMVEMIQTAANLNPQNRFVALLWHQGETDAFLQASFETHYENLKRLVSMTRDTCKAPELPFVAGDFVEQWRGANAEICAPVLSAMRQICGEDSYAAFVETDGLLSNSQVLGGEDTIHFCRDALNQLGSRYFSAFAAIRDKAANA